MTQRARTWSGRAIASLVLVALTTAWQAAAGAQPTPPQAQQAWVPPRTPWGDPDIEGIYSNRHELGTPIERPSKFAGRTSSQITPNELSQIRREDERRLTDPDRGGLTVVWHGRPLELHLAQRPWLTIEPPDGRQPPLTAEGLRRRDLQTRQARLLPAADSYSNRGMWERCISRGLPTSGLPHAYASAQEFTQAPGYVVIRYEMVHEARVIPLDGRPHVGEAIRMHMGDSRGRWEGGTLVVETTNITDASAFRGAVGTTLRLVERFTRTTPDLIEWTVSIEDPSTWRQPWVLASQLRRDDRERVLEYACHEGNYGMRNILRNGRVRDAQWGGALRLWDDASRQLRGAGVTRRHAYSAAIGMATIVGLLVVYAAARRLRTPAVGASRGPNGNPI